GRLTGIFAQWEVTRQHFPPGAPVLVTGCPVRGAFRERLVVLEGQNEGESGEGRGSEEKDGILESFGLEQGRRTLLVTGASQGARTINEALVRLAPTIAAAGWQVLHLSGPAD